MIKEVIKDILCSYTNIDYISVKCRGDQAHVLYYLNCVTSLDVSVLEYLKQFENFKFLLDDDLVLFYTKQQSEFVALSYEYKIKYVANDDPRFQRLISPWEQDVNFDKISYFAQEHRLNGAFNGGILCFGIEFPLGRVQTLRSAILKLYFKTYYTDSENIKIYDNPFYLDFIRNSQIPEFIRLCEIAEQLIPLGYDLYMVSWNYDAEKGTDDYKLYFYRNENECPQALFKKLGEFSFCAPSAVEQLSAEDLMQDVRLMGFAISINSNNESRVNYYFKERKK